jgi:transcription elongation factor/antiterminator RfaH
MPSELISAWYALHTKSRFENVVNDGLQKKTIEVFLPKITVPSKRKDRKKMIRVPLFPGYVFVKTDLHPDHHLEIVKTVGAVKLVGDKTGPISVQDDIVESIKIMTATDQPIATGGYQFQKGDRVLVVDGPFSGVIGVFERFGAKGRIVVHIEALGQFAAVEVDADDVEKLPDISA